MRPFELVIFDCDGVLVDSERLMLERDLEAVIGIADAIEAARLATCVASSGSHDKMALTLGRTGLSDWFDGRIHSATDPEVAEGKPAPDLFLHAARSMGVEPAKCAVVEDRPYGVAAALAAGMTPFGFGGSVIPADRLAGDGVTVFDSMAALPSLVIAPD